jgi:hypothetical protein
MLPFINLIFSLISVVFVFSDSDLFSILDIVTLRGDEDERERMKVTSSTVFEELFKDAKTDVISYLSSDIAADRGDFLRSICDSLCSFVFSVSAAFVLFCLDRFSHKDSC